VTDPFVCQVTLALAAWRGFPLRKVPGYITAQVLGGLVGAAIVYGNYFHAIDIAEGGRGIRTLKTAGLFATYAVRRHGCHWDSWSNDPRVPGSLFDLSVVLFFRGTCRIDILDGTLD
jgi:hypothetical protein